MRACLAGSLRPGVCQTFISLEPEQTKTRAFRARCKVAVMLFPASLCLVTNARLGLTQSMTRLRRLYPSRGRKPCHRFKFQWGGGKIYFQKREGRLVGERRSKKNNRPCPSVVLKSVRSQ